MSEFSPGNSDICFTCHAMHQCTDYGELPPCVKCVEVLKPSPNTRSDEIAWLNERSLGASTITCHETRANYLYNSINDRIAQLRAVR
jgi:hypothetical protein